MQSDRPVLVTSVNRQRLPVLIIDKRGMIGLELARRLQQQFLVLLVGGKELEVEHNVIHIPYRKKIPLIPDHTYSHMFLIYNGEDELLDMLPSFVKKAHETHARIFLITSLQQSNHRLFHRLSNHQYHNVQILLYGETFENNLSEQNELNYFINQIRLRGEIPIPNTGLGLLYPVLLDDVLDAIVSVGFALERRARILFLFPKQGITEISVGRILQKINPTVRLDFKKQRRKAAEYYIPEGGQSFYADYDLERRLKMIDFNRKVTLPSEVPPKKIPLPRTRRNTSILFVASVVIFSLLLLPAFVSLTFALAGAFSLNQSVKQIERANFSSAKTYASVANISFNSAETALRSFYLMDIFAKNLKGEAMAQITIGEELTQTELDVVDACMQLQKVVDGKSLDPKNDFLQSLATFKNAFIVLQRIKGDGQLPKLVQSKMSDINDLLVLLENTSDSFPVLFGFTGKRTYLILFQNNMELRPGGGFIGSYGLLTINKGQIGSFKAYDVYDADGRLSTPVEPPYALRRYLGATHWFLRDSSFDIDFTRDAQQASKFLQMETNTHVDGVISIDTDFMRNIISAFGSVYVPDYNETVTPDNFYLLTETHAEKNFFPGSTQKKDFLRALTNALVLRLSEKDNLPYRVLFKKIGESIKSKHLLFAFPDQAIQTLFTVNNLSSSLWDGRTPGKDTFLDFLGVVDANVGANKANYYVSRSVRHDISFDDTGDIEEKVTVTYENTSRKDSVFGGNYSNYVRFVLPNNAILRAVAVDGQEIQTTPAITDPAIFTQPGFIPPSDLEVADTQEEGKSIVGFFVTIPTGSTKSVRITYTIPGAVNVDDPAFSYSLRVFKEPGTRDDPYTLSFAYPNTDKLINKNENMVDLGGKETYETTITSDKDVKMVFSKK